METEAAATVTDEVSGHFAPAASSSEMREAAAQPTVSSGGVQVAPASPGLDTLREMGFNENLAMFALQASDGDVEAALAQLCADRDDLDGADVSNEPAVEHATELPTLLASRSSDMPVPKKP